MKQEVLLAADKDMANFIRGMGQAPSPKTPSPRGGRTRPSPTPPRRAFRLITVLAYGATLPKLRQVRYVRHRVEQLRLFLYH
jgi:hypothetical protein